ncbi:MAG TPA: methionine synthase [Kineosporiaceae bacterium]|nr:methionine synthase [Kineosporiaceae bacterium]
MLENAPERASGIGSWPGTDVEEAQRTTFGELPDPGIPYLPELPARGPGSDLIGRGAALLIETPVDLQPSGWRLVSRPGRDLHRAQAMLRQDLDVLAEVADGYRGPLKLQVCGPWTLAASVNLPRLERAVADPGACRDLTSSLAEGLSAHLAEVRRSVPGAEVVVQFDEPSLPAVLLGRLPTSSGFGRLRSIDDEVAVESLRTVLAAATAGGAVETVVHCCSGDLPIGLLLRAGVDGLSVDVSLLGVAGWEELAPAVEGGTRLWAGAVGTSWSLPSAAAVADAVWTPWRRLGLSTSLLAGVVVTPACGLSGLSPVAARAALERAVQAAKELAHRAQE